MAATYLSIWKGTGLNTTKVPIKDGQLLFETDTRKIWLDAGTSRIQVGGQDTIAWSNITGKPSTFSPSEHYHDFITDGNGKLAVTINVRPTIIAKYSGTTPSFAFEKYNDENNLQWHNYIGGIYDGTYTILDNHNYNEFALPLTGGELTGGLYAPGIQIKNNAYPQVLFANSNGETLGILFSNSVDGNYNDIRIRSHKDVSTYYDFGFTGDGTIIANHFTGNATTASSLSSKEPTLSIGHENSAITIKGNANGALGIDSYLSLKTAIDFKWYDSNWQIGNLRSGGTPSAGFGFACKQEGEESFSLKARITPYSELILGSSADSWVTLGPNTLTQHGNCYLGGTAKHGYYGILLGNSTNYMTVMSGTTHQGLYNDANSGWIIYYNRENGRIGLGTSDVEGYTVTVGGSLKADNLYGTLYGSASSLVVNNNESWHNVNGVRAFRYEHVDATNFKLPTSNVSVLTLTSGSNRGAALAIHWTNAGPHTYVTQLHDDTSNYNWGNWVELYSPLNKPTANEIGALPSSGGVLGGNLIHIGNSQSANHDGSAGFLKIVRIALQPNAYPDQPFEIKVFRRNEQASHTLYFTVGNSGSADYSIAYFSVLGLKNDFYIVETQTNVFDIYSYRKSWDIIAVTSVTSGDQSMNSATISFPNEFVASISNYVQASYLPLYGAVWN